MIEKKKTLRQAAGEREGDDLKDFKDVRAEIGSSQGQNLALNGLSVQSSLDNSASL